MGNGASVKESSAALSIKDFPQELFVEGAGSVRAIGKFVLQTGKERFPLKSISGVERSAWFAKDNDEGCWMGLSTSAENGQVPQWIIFTAKDILYVAPIADPKITPPRQGRWELGDGGAAPAPTVNLQPLPAAFRLSGWLGEHDCLNGEYLPLDDGTELLNERSIFKHAPVMGIWAHKDKWRMYWSQGAWRIGDKDKLKTDQVQCIALFESDVIHPTAKPEVVWKDMANANDFGKDENDSHFVEGVSMATGTSVQIYLSQKGGDAVVSLTVRPWFDMVEDLQAKAFAVDTPEQRQQLFFDGKQLQDDGRVLAQHGVVAETTIQLVTLEKIAVLDPVFDTFDAVGAFDEVGDPASAEEVLLAFNDACYSPVDGRICLPPCNASRVARFDPATETWDTFGDTFPQTQPFFTDKWTLPTYSSVDNCIYCMPWTYGLVHRILKIDSVNNAAYEVGEDLRSFTSAKAYAWIGTIAGADGYVYGIPCQADSVVRFDPRTNEISTFGKLESENVGLQEMHATGVLPASWNIMKWGAGVLGPNGRYIFGLPFMASKVLCIDTQTLTVELIGVDTGQWKPVSGMRWFDYMKYWGGSVGGDNCIYLIPFSLYIGRILRIDPVAKTTSFFGPHLKLYNSSAFLSGEAGMDGCIYAFPHTAGKRRILQIDPFAGTVRYVGNRIPSHLGQKLGHGTCDEDGNIWYSMMNMPSKIVRMRPRRPQTPLLTLLLQPKHHAVLQEGLRDLRCYAPAVVVALWREAVRAGGDPGLVSGLLEAAAPVLPSVITASIKKDNGSMANMLLRTILAVLPPQESDFYFNRTLNTWEWHETEAKKRGMHMASVASEEEHAILSSIAGTSEAWLGGRRKSASQHPPNFVDSEDQYGGPDDWEWSDGTPWSFHIWNAVEPNNGSGLEDRVFVSGETWSDSVRGKMMAGIYRKARYPLSLEIIREIVTDQHTLRQCFAVSKELRDNVTRMLYRTLSHTRSLKHSAPPTNQPKSRVLGGIRKYNSVASAITNHIKTKWSDLSSMIEAIFHAPPELSANDRDRFDFLSYFTAALAILQAPSPNDWRPLPESPGDWSWPPAPLVPLRAACKIVQRLGPGSISAVWPILANVMSRVLARMVDAVRGDVDHAADLLTKIFNRERKGSLETYQKQLRRARRDPTFPEYKRACVELVEKLVKLQRNELRVQTTSSYPELYKIAHGWHKRFNDFLAALAQKCAAAKVLHAPLKGIARALEKIVLRPGSTAKFKANGVEGLDSKYIVDNLRGSLECPNFINIVFILDLLQLLDVDLGSPAKAKSQGWDLDRFQIRIINIKDRFSKPTSGGWADAMVNFCFAHGDNTHHVMELQLQHTQMLVVRKEGKAHDRYNSFRSAFELLESVGREPRDCFDETNEDLPPLQKLERRIMKQHQQLQSRVECLEKVGSEPQDCFDDKKEALSPLQKLEQRMEQRMKQQQKQIDDLKSENEILRFKLNTVLESAKS